jgi:hypothetical protein
MYRREKHGLKMPSTWDHIKLKLSRFRVWAGYRIIGSRSVVIGMKNPFPATEISAENSITIYRCLFDESGESRPLSADEAW